MLTKLTVVILISGYVACFAQDTRHQVISDSIGSHLEKTLGHKYQVWGRDVDETIQKPPYGLGTFRDPFNTLTGCFIFTASGESSGDLPGRVGIYRIKSDSVLWISVPLSSDFASGVMGIVDQTGELNHDGQVEIIVAQGKPPIETQQLWIFSWNGKTGKLITQIDANGESTIFCYGKYELVDVDGDGILEIRGRWYKNQQATDLTTITYSWNGVVYGKWAKASKALLRGNRKR